MTTANRCSTAELLTSPPCPFARSPIRYLSRDAEDSVPRKLAEPEFRRLSRGPFDLDQRPVELRPFPKSRRVRQNPSQCGSASFETRSGGAPLRMRSIISKAYLTLRRPPFETPPARLLWTGGRLEGCNTEKPHFSAPC